MGAASLLIFAASLSAAGEKVPNYPCTVTMVAVQATKENRNAIYFGPGLEAVTKPLASLRDYDTFNHIQSAQVTSPYGQEKAIVVNSKYTLCINPVSVMDDGRVRIRARITQYSKDGTQVANALETTIQVRPGSPINLGGLHLDKGDLVVVVSVK